jgi:arylsulfatase A-like enzyme
MNRRPNIVFMISDDHRYNAVHCCGNAIVKTPSLDALANGGVCFRETRILGGESGAVCVPSRACVHTGVNPFRALTHTGKNNKAGRTIEPGLALLPETLRNAGYHTFATGKWHNDTDSFTRAFCDGANLFFGGMSDHWKVPLHRYRPDGDYSSEEAYVGDKFSSELFREAAVQFIEKYDREQPFFLYVAFTSPHDPRTPPPQYAEMYDPEAIPLPGNFMEDHPFDNGDLYTTRDEKLADWPRDPQVIRQHIADYYGMITHMDAQIGRILDALREKGLAENTIVVYTADHGVSIGQHGLMGKQNVYDHSIRVPLMLSGPGIPAQPHHHALTYSYDLFPTLCELTSIPIPATVESKSLVPLIHGEQSKIRDSVFTVYRDIQRTVSDGEWKLIRYYRAKTREAGADRLQLFHLIEDPEEKNDLARVPEHREQIHRLARHMEEWQSQVSDPLSTCRVIPE